MTVEDVKEILGIDSRELDAQITAVLPLMIDALANEIGVDLAVALPLGLQLVIASDVLRFILANKKGMANISSERLGDYSVSYSDKLLSGAERGRLVSGYKKVRFI